MTVVDAFLASPRDFGLLLKAMGGVALGRVEAIVAERLDRAEK